MAKLVYKTKAPRKGYVFNQADSTHERKDYRDKLPPNEVQTKALNLVSDQLYKLVKDLTELGYDPTRVRFSIHYDSFNKCNYGSNDRTNSSKKKS